MNIGNISDNTSNTDKIHSVGNTDSKDNIGKIDKIQKGDNKIYPENINNEDNMYSRTRLVLGDDGINNLQNARVLIFGVGGVGSYVVEALARAGVGNITIFDGDVVAPSNINRQLIALNSTIGMQKVKVMEARIKDVNPKCKVLAKHVYVDKTNIDDILFEEYDYVVDAIDSVTSKLLIIERCTKNNVRIISSMGTGNKLHPELFQITDISKTQVCPLARVMRKELKAREIYKLKVLFSPEQPLKHNPPASVSFVPSVAGLMIAGEVIRELAVVEG